MSTSSSCVGGNNISVSGGSIPARKIWDFSFFFLFIFNYCSHSTVTGWPTTATLAWLALVSWPYARLSVCFFLLFYFFSLSFRRNSLYHLDLPYHVTLLLIICLHTVKWFQVFLPYFNSFVYALLNSLKYCYLVLVILFSIMPLFAHN